MHIFKVKDTAGIHTGINTNTVAGEGIDLRKSYINATVILLIGGRCRIKATNYVIMHPLLYKVFYNIMYVIHPAIVLVDGYLI